MFKQMKLHVYEDDNSFTKFTLSKIQQLAIEKVLGLEKEDGEFFIYEDNYLLNQLKKDEGNNYQLRLVR